MCVYTFQAIDEVNKDCLLFFRCRLLRNPHKFDYLFSERDSHFAVIVILAINSLSIRLIKKGCCIVVATIKLTYRYVSGASVSSIQKRFKCNESLVTQLRQLLSRSLMYQIAASHSEESPRGKHVCAAQSSILLPQNLFRVAFYISFTLSLQKFIKQKFILNERKAREMEKKVKFMLYVEMGAWRW